jgi:hypothetical protein
MTPQSESKLTGVTYSPAIAVGTKAMHMLKNGNGSIVAAGGVVSTLSLDSILWKAKTFLKGKFRT